jgi:hypothetical protein
MSLMGGKRPFGGRRFILRVRASRALDGWPGPTRINRRYSSVGLFGHASETQAFVKMFPITRRLKNDPGYEIAYRGVRLDR